jgi:hypothetical protein
MSYTVVRRDSDGTVQAKVCMFIDQKKIEVAQAFRNPHAVEIEVIVNPDRSNNEAKTLEKWILKKPFLGIFGKTKWVELPVVR